MFKKSFKANLALLAGAFFIAGLATLARAEDRVLNVANWTDYIDPAVLEEFTKETGIKIVYDTYDSNEMLETRLLAGSTGYDLVVPSATFLQRQIQAGVYQKLDKAQLPNLKNLQPEIMQRLAVYDPGAEYSAPYMWFTTGVAYNVAKAKERLGDRPIDSWDIVFKPDLIAKFADCGVYFLDSPEDMFAIGANYLGLPPDVTKPEDIAKVASMLAAVRPSVRKFHSSEYINALANGDICLAIGWAGDSFQARNRAREAKNGVEIGYVIPREGTLISIDVLAIPKDAKHVAEAHRFIDYLLRPKVEARNTQVSNFANPILASREFLPPDVRDNKAIYPDEETMRKLFTVSPKDQAVQKIITREWQRVKLGR
ncbi:MAG: polyamine ABC transporter substrate-binding protein [Hyphomicrobiales bacterium]|nr:polyamine ABC transporter substrate-binding protein [Hyphomicrobiales bacterium]